MLRSTRPLAILAALFCLAPAARADESRLVDPGAARDGLLTEAAAVPQGGTVRVSAGGGADTSSATASSAGTVGAVNASVLWSIGGRAAIGFGGVMENGQLTPSASLRFQLLTEEKTGVNMTAAVRYKTAGFDPRGSEVEAAADVGKSIGRVTLVGNAVAGKGVGGGDDGVDVEARTGASWGFSDQLRAGVEARYRAEVELDHPAARPAGRSFDFVAGPAVSWRLGMLQLQALAGWGAPRGALSTGPTALALASFDF